MFEGWFGKKNKEESQTKDPDAFMNEGLAAFSKLSPEWQKKVTDMMAPAREKYFKPRKFYPEHGVYDPEYYQILEDVVYTAAVIEEEEREARSRMRKIADETLRHSKNNAVPIALIMLLNAGIWTRAEMAKAAEAEKIGISAAVLGEFKKADDRVFHHDKVTIFKRGKHTKDMPEVRFDSSRVHMPVDGFEKFNIPEGVIRQAIEETLPKFLLANVKKVEYVDKSIPMLAAYGKKMPHFEAAHYDRGNGVLTLSRGAIESTVSQCLNDILGHEFGHGSDWMSNDLLSIEERLELLDKIIARVQSPGRFKSWYIEEISNVNKDSELWGKVTEYFPEILYAYLSDDYVKLPAADRKIIRELIAKFDPEFDRVAALKKRNKIIQDIEAKLDFERKHPKESDFEDK